MARRKDISRTDILKTAQGLIEARGFNGFSIRDLADEVGISSASLHHYHPTKADLVTTVLVQYREGLNKRIGLIDAELDELQARVFRLTQEMSQSAPHGMTLAAVMMADFNTLPSAVRDEALLLTSNIIGWLTRFVTQAKNHDELPIDSLVENIVQDIYAKLLGGALITRLKEG